MAVHTTVQALLNVGVNVFGLQLLLESLPPGDGSTVIEVEHKGRVWFLYMAARAPEGAPGEGA